jgi:hypothetical protein
MNVQSDADRCVRRGFAVPRARLLLDAAAILLASGVAQLMAYVQGAEPVDGRWLLAFAALAILFLHVGGPRTGSSVGDVYTVLTATALAAVLVAILRLQVVLDAAAAGETLRQWAFAAVYVIAVRAAASWYTSPQRADTAAETREDGADFFLLAARELARARRHSLPLTAVVLDPRPDSTLDLGQRDRDLRELRAALEQEVRLTDAFGVVQGRIVAVLPETRSGAVAPLLDRVRSRLAPALAERLRVGSAAFPDEETTFVGLHERAVASTGAVQSAEPLPQGAVA